MANRTVYPYGTDGQLPSSIGIVNDLSTGGADKALSAEMGKELNENFIISSSIFQNGETAAWLSGNVSNGSIVTNYANRYIVIILPEDADEFTISREAPDSTYTLGVYGSVSGSNYVSLANFTAASDTKVFTKGTYTRILLLLWDKPSTERAQAEEISIYYNKHIEPLNRDEISDLVFSQEGSVPAIELVRQMARDLWTKTLTTVDGDYYWAQGGINGQTGAETVDNTAIRSSWIPVNGTEQMYISPSNIEGWSFAISIYDNTKSFIASSAGFGDVTESLRSRLQTSDGFIRLFYYTFSGSHLSPSNATANALTITKTRVNRFATPATVPYMNPVIRRDLPDPTVWDGEDGYYYLFATGKLSTATMWRSSNLYEWENAGDAPFSEETAAEVATAFGQGSTDTTFWAPHVFKVNPTTWNLYLSKPQGGLAILTSNHPTRGYVFSKFISKPSEAGEFIDAELGYDTDGKLWLFTGGSGSIYRREMTADGLDWAEGSSFALVAGMAHNATGNVNREKTFEGPYLYRREGYWYLFCSSGLYSQGNYKLRVMRSQSLSGAFVDSEGNAGLDGYADTVLISGTTLTGPGHNAPIFVDRHNQNWIIYHSHWSGFQSSSWRGVCLDQVEWDENGWPFINDGKPSTQHDAPQM